MTNSFNDDDDEFKIQIAPVSLRNSNVGRTSERKQGKKRMQKHLTKEWQINNSSFASLISKLVSIRLSYPWWLLRTKAKQESWQSCASKLQTNSGTHFLERMHQDTHKPRSYCPCSISECSNRFGMFKELKMLPCQLPTWLTYYKLVWGKVAIAHCSVRPAACLGRFILYPHSHIVSAWEQFHSIQCCRT